MDDEILELINSYVDGRIGRTDERRLKTLLAGDAVLARDVEFLVRQRRLCLSDKATLPCDVAGVVIGRLNDRRHISAAHKFGIRRFFNVSAIVLMVLALGGVLVAIVGPFAAGNGRGVRNIAAKTPIQSDTNIHSPAAAVMMFSKGEAKPMGGLCNYYLTLSTKDIAKTERVLGQLFYEHNLLNGVNVSRQPGKTFYNVQCTQDEFEHLAANISPLWSNAESVSLEFSDYTTRSRINVDGITAMQLEKIVTAPETGNKIKTAAAAAAMNSLPAVPMSSFEKGYDVPANLFSMRPVLAGSRNTRAKKISDADYISVSIKIQSHN